MPTVAAGLGTGHVVTEAGVDSAWNVRRQILVATPLLVLQIETAIHDHPPAAEMSGECVRGNDRRVHLTLILQRRDAIFERRMRGEE